MEERFSESDTVGAYVQGEKRERWGLLFTFFVILFIQSIFRSIKLFLLVSMVNLVLYLHTMGQRLYMFNIQLF